MFLVVCSPFQLRSDFASFVDSKLSKELDWYLTLFIERETSPPSPRLPIHSVLVSEYSLDLRSGSYDPDLQGLETQLAICGFLRSNCDTWVFDLSPQCTVDGIDQMIRHFDNLGCFSGLFRPRADASVYQRWGTD